MRRSSAGGDGGRAGGGDLGALAGLGVAERGEERGRVGVEGEAALDGEGPLVGVEGRRDVDGEAEAIEQLRAQLALLRVHRPDEHEPGRVLVADAFALDAVDAGRGHVEQHVDEMVGEEVDLVDVEHAAVGGGQHTGFEAPLPRPAARRRDRACRRPDPRWRRAGARRTVPRRAGARPGRGPAWSWPRPSGRAAARRPCSGETAARSSASLASSWPTTAVNGNRGGRSAPRRCLVQTVGPVPPEEPRQPLGRHEGEGGVGQLALLPT